MYNPNWSHVDVDSVPHMVTSSPGPRSQEMHGRTTKYMKGLSSQVKLFPVAFESRQRLHADRR